MKRFVTLCVSLAAIALIASLLSPVFAQYGAYTGGTQDTGIVIDKQVSVRAPGASKTTFVDNLSSTDSRYAPEETVTFTLRIRNTSDKAYGTVVVRDYMPEYLIPVKYQFAAGTRTITIAAGRLDKGQEKTYTIASKVVKNDQLPQDKTVTCIVNKAQVDAAGASDQDTSQFCVERQVQGVSQVPAAGAEDAAWTALALAMIGSGLYLRRKSDTMRA